MNLQRLVIGFIVISSAAVLVAGLWFKAPRFPAHGSAPATTGKPAAPALENLPAPLTAANH